MPGTTDTLRLTSETLARTTETLIDSQSTTISLASTIQSHDWLYWMHLSSRCVLAIGVLTLGIVLFRDLLQARKKTRTWQTPLLLSFIVIGLAGISSSIMVERIRTVEKTPNGGLFKGAELRMELGKALGGVIAGILAIWGLYYTDKRHKQTDAQLIKAGEQINLTREQLRITEQGNLTERFARAVEMLGSMRTEKIDGKEQTKPNLEVRLGGIYSLERLAKDSPDDRPQIVELLSAYIRENARHDGKKPVVERMIGIDVQAVLTVLGRMEHRAKEKDTYPVLDLSNTDLLGAFLPYAHLEFTHFYKAHLDVTTFIETYLEGANFEGAHLKRTDFGGAHLEGAHFEGTDLSSAENLTQLQIDSAHGDEATILPPLLTRPTRWVKHKAQPETGKPETGKPD